MSNVTVVTANMTIANLLTLALKELLSTGFPFLSITLLSPDITTLGIRFINIWNIVMERMVEMYHRNHKSINLKYDVLGKSPFTEERRATRTSKVVTVPMNLSEKFSMSIKRVKYARNESSPVGRKVPNIWSITLC